MGNVSNIARVRPLARPWGTPFMPILARGPYRSGCRSARIAWNAEPGTPSGNLLVNDHQMEATTAYPGNNNDAEKGRNTACDSIEHNPSSRRGIHDLSVTQRSAARR